MSSWSVAAAVATLAASTSATLAQVDILRVDRSVSVSQIDTRNPRIGGGALAQVYHADRASSTQPGEFTRVLVTPTKTYTSTVPNEAYDVRVASGQRSSITPKSIRFDGENAGFTQGTYSTLQYFERPTGGSESWMTTVFRVTRPMRVQITLVESAGQLTLAKNVVGNEEMIASYFDGKLSVTSLPGTEPSPAPRVAIFTLQPGDYTIRASAARRFAFQADFLGRRDREVRVSDDSFGAKQLNDDATAAQSTRGPSSGSNSNNNSGTNGSGGNAGSGSTGGGTTPPPPRRARGDDRRRR